VGHEALLQALADGAVVATANARLARSLRADFERGMVAAGRAAWPTPAVLPLSAWLVERHGEAALRGAAALPRLLTATQEEQVWAGIIGQGPALLRVDATARRARATWRLLRYWHLSLDDPRFADNENAAAFADWARQFRRHCHEQGQMSESDLPALLGPLWSRGECRVPGRLLLAGFFEREPAVESLATLLRATGAEVEWVRLEGVAGAARRLRADDRRHEMRLAAAWAHGLLEANPRARIGIVVPDLAERRAALAHRLTATLSPGALRPGAGHDARPWNLSLGQPLSDQPVIATALRLLALMEEPADTAAVGVLLASPHWSLPEDAAARRDELARRALLDRRLRAEGDAAIRLRDLRFQCTSHDRDGAPGAWNTPLLAQCLDGLLAQSRDLPRSGDASDWAPVFTAWLSAAGWRHGRPLDSAEYQAVEAWNDLLSQFSGLADFAGRLARGGALGLLRRLASATLFQPRSDDAPVQVLGLYEADGQRFDHLWVMGLHDGAWPEAASPDPFLPLSLQRERGLPLCDPDRAREWAARMTGELAGAAPDVVFSYPAQEGAEELRCSPLIGGFDEIAHASLVPVAADAWWECIRQSAEPEPAPAADPIPFRPAGARGGSRLFGNQAACPFRAFAEHRLGARPLDRLQIGLGPMRRGTVMHKVLEALWRELQTQAALLALDEADLRARVRRHIAEVLETRRQRSPVTMGARYSALEAGRLEDKILAWLEVERQRSPFRVAGFEELQRFAIGGLEVQLKLDRIDALDDGSRVVLDYKTGQVKASAWFGDRPDDPQLPLYGVAAGAGPQAAPVAAVAFAQLRADEQGFRGVVREQGLLPGLPPRGSGPVAQASAHWPAVLGEWSTVLAGLAEAFRAGDPAVDPKSGLRTCEHTYCELAALCRVRERLPGTGDDGAEEFETGGEGGA